MLSQYEISSEHNTEIIPSTHRETETDTERSQGQSSEIKIKRFRISISSWQCRKAINKNFQLNQLVGVSLFFFVRLLAF